MQVVYDQFIERTAAARHMTPEKVDEIAQGRVWTGAQAKQLGLVDELGGLYKADRSREAARAHSRRTRKSSWWCIRRIGASTKC